jgi:uncharacterized YigZ family protein
LTTSSTDLYRTVSHTSEGSFKDKGSKFLAFAFPIASEDEAKTIVNDLRKKYHDARHHCFAYRIDPENPKYRVNDDGEPSGTAGKPIYGQILSNKLFNILIVVVRYFGGILLGTSGLINAYKLASIDCINNAAIIERTIETYFDLKFQYDKMNLVMRVIKEENIRIVHQDFKVDCKMRLSIRKNNYKKAIERLEKVENLTIQSKIL